MSVTAQAKRRRTQARNRRLGVKTGRIFVPKVKAVMGAGFVGVSKTARKSGVK